MQLLAVKWCLKIILENPIGSRIPTYVVLSNKTSIKNKEELKEKISTALQQMHKDGTYQKIIEHFFKIVFSNSKIFFKVVVLFFVTCRFYGHLATLFNPSKNPPVCLRFKSFMLQNQ